jgi:hypothetical protein
VLPPEIAVLGPFAIRTQDFMYLGQLQKQGNSKKTPHRVNKVTGVKKLKKRNDAPRLAFRASQSPNTRLPPKVTSYSLPNLLSRVEI